MSGWDWLNAGMDIMIYDQARKAQKNLGAMKTAAEMETARRALIEAMRNFIFNISKDIDLVEKNIDEYPQQVYIVSKALEGRLQDSGLTPEIFPEFSDKDYVYKTQSKVDEVISKAQSKLTPEKISQSETAVSYVVQMPLLRQAVTAKSSLEQIQTTEQEWNKVNGLNGTKTFTRILGFIGLGVTFCFGWYLGILGLAMLTSGNSGNAFFGFILLAIAFCIPAGSIALLIYSGKNNPRFAELKTNRETWKKNLMSLDDWNRVKELFGGDLPSNEFEKIYNDRVSFLQPILGGEFEKFLTAGNG